MPQPGSRDLLEHRLAFIHSAMVHLPYSNRAEAGKLLGAELKKHKLPRNAVVLALPRGGVPVGFEVAEILHAPLDVVVVRKLGVPWQPELAMGAVAGGTMQVLDENLIAELRIPQADIDAVIERERAQVDRREKLYRDGRPKPQLGGKVCILVDDGLATGSTMLVAAQYVRALKPAGMMVAVPVGTLEACGRLQNVADEVVCLATPEPFLSVGSWFDDFRQVTDEEVQNLLRQRQPHSETLELHRN